MIYEPKQKYDVSTLCGRILDLLASTLPLLPSRLFLLPPQFLMGLVNQHSSLKIFKKETTKRPSMFFSLSPPLSPLYTTASHHQEKHRRFSTTTIIILCQHSTRLRFIGAFNSSVSRGKMSFCCITFLSSSPSFFFFLGPLCARRSLRKERAAATVTPTSFF